VNEVRTFSTAYKSALHAHVRERDEHTLHSAYELGRQAVASNLGLLDVAGAHHDALLAAVHAHPSAGIDYVLDAAADFLVETLSTYEMVKRGFADERAAARAQRHQAAMIRNLSAFLADAALAATSHDALTEVLQLVAEHARELTAAQAAVVVVQPVKREFCAAYSHEDETTRYVSARDALRDAARIVSSGAAKARVSTPETGRHQITAALARFDRTMIGALQVMRSDREFSDVDEAVIAHVAQLTSPTLERVLSTK
jgi:hypothetical protein